MILRDVDNIKVGSTSVNKVYQGNYKVYDKNKIALEGYCKQGVPSEYQQVEYIESTGTQWIHTGFPLFNYENHEIIMDFAPTAFFNYNSLFGSSYDADTFEGWIYANGDLRCRYNMVRYCNTDYSITVNTRYLLDIKKEGTTLSEYLDNNLIGTGTTTTKLTDASFYLFKSGTDLGRIKLYGCKLYSNGTLVRNFIPCYRKSDSVIGLYDLVNNVFYTNAGTGTFNKGADVPNPNYPQEIEVMEGKQVVNVSSENMIDILTLDVGYVGGLGNIITNDTSNGVMYSEFIKVEPNTTYRFKIFETSSNYPNWFRVGLYSSNNINTFIERQTMTSASQNYIQFTTTSTTNYIRVSGRNLAAATKIMLYKGTTEKPYIPYKSQDFEVDLESKNKFDNITEKKLISTDGGIYNNDSWNLGDYIKVKPNTQYTFVRFDGTQQSLIIAEYDINQTFIQRNTQGSTNQNIPYTITTSNTTEYIRLNYNSTYGTTKLQLEEGSTATDYEPYYNYKLAGIGDYKDNIYTKEGKWYVHKKLEKYVFNGSESFNFIERTGVNVFINNNTLVNLIRKLANEINIISDYFLGIMDKQGNVANSIRSNNSGQVFITVPTSNPISASANAFTTWLANNNVTSYYVLETPTEEEITSPTLIQQLNRLYQAM